MENITICRQMHLRDKKENINYRVLNVTRDYAVLINMNTPDQLDISLVNNKEIRKKIHLGNLEIINEPNNDTIVDQNYLSEYAKIKYLRNKQIIDLINMEYAPDYIGLVGHQDKPIINKIIDTTKLARSTIWRIIIKYLQNGCTEKSLLDYPRIPSKKYKLTKNKRGRISNIKERNAKNLTENDLEIMSKYTQKYLSNKQITIVKCYDDMIADNYCKETYDGTSYKFEELPANQKPSLRQFAYYLKQKTSKEERQAAKTGKREYRNQKRLFTGTSRKNVFGPGDIIEMDACELDISVVSATDRSKAVGSPVVYFMIDLYSRLILGASLSFDNNSILALTNCLASLVEDKSAILQELDLTIAETKSGLSLDDIMPSYIKPRIIRTDHGSDFISKETQRIAKEIDLELQYAPPGTGSLKGVVERSFRAFQAHFIDLTSGAGTKEHNTISKHNQQAKLTIEDVRKLMYAFILTHNTTQHESAYNLTPDMVKNKVGQIPAEIWRYGIQYGNNPAYITDKKQFLYSLLIPQKAKLKRGGIYYKHLRYIPDLDNDTAIGNKMLYAGNGSLPFEIRIDIRTVSEIYYLDNTSTTSTKRSAKLVDDVFHRELARMTWPEYEAFLKAENQLKKEKSIESDKTRRAFRRISKDIVAEAKRLSGKEKTNTKDMRDTRALEKSRVAQELAFNTKFGLVEPTPVKSLPNPIEKKEEPNVESTENNKNILPDLNNMTEEEKEQYLYQLAKEMMEDYEDN